MSQPSEMVCLKGGLTVPLPALEILWALENRRFKVRASNGLLEVEPASQLTAADRLQIVRHRNDLLALVAYEPEMA